MNETVTLGQSVVISLASMAVVFAVLVLIASCINLMTKLVGSDLSVSRDNKKDKNKNELENVIDNNDELELISVISATIACKLGLKISDISINSIKNRSY